MDKRENRQNATCLKTLRESKHLTTREIAQMANMSYGHYSNIENGKRQPSVKTAKVLADILGFEWADLFKKTL